MDGLPHHEPLSQECLASWQESMKALFRSRAKAERGLATEWVCMGVFWGVSQATPSCFEYFDYLFISVILSTMMLFETPRRLA